MSMAEYPSIRALMARHSTLLLCSAVFVAYVTSHFQIYDAAQNLQGSGLETLAVARSLALTGKFADPFAPMATGPTAHLAPVYPAALGLIVQRYGEGPSAVPRLSG